MARATPNSRPKKRPGVKEATTHKWVKENVTRTHNPVAAAIRAHAVQSVEERDKDRDTDHIHPSEIAKKDWCPRQTFYRISGDEPDDETAAPLYWRLANIFEEGHGIHDKYQGWLWEMGVLEGMWKCLLCNHRWWAVSPAVCDHCASYFIRYAEVPVYLPEYHVIGHGDGIYNDSEIRVLLEVKSIGLRSVEIEMPGVYSQWQEKGESFDGLWGRIKTPFPTHVRQVHPYLHYLYHEMDIDTVMYIYEFKVNQDFKVFTAKYNPRIAEPLLARAKEVLEARDSGVPPARPEWAENDKSKGCKDCPFKERCWHGQAGEEEE